LPSYLIYKPSDYTHPYVLFSCEPIRATRQYGLINYAVTSIHYLNGISHEEEEELEEYMAVLYERQSKMSPLVPFQNKNLIVILVESYGDWALNTTIDGVEIAPNLNRLVKENGVLYFSKVLPQVKGGRSSDAQLLLNTGLLPVQDGAASFLCSANELPSLPKALKEKGYVSLNFLCDDKAYWNQEATSKAYGFDEIYDHLGQVETRYGQDENLFKNAMPRLKAARSPFYAQLVTISTHDAEECPYPSALKNKIADKNIGCMAVLFQYTDECIGRFLNELKKENLYDNSIIIITADHDGIGRNMLEGRDVCTLQDRYIPFIVINSPLQAETDKVIGQVDIYPSILDMIGGMQYRFKGLGESVFRHQAGAASYKDGAMAADGAVADSIVSSKRKQWQMSDFILRSDFFKTHRKFL